MEKQDFLDQASLLKKEKQSLLNDIRKAYKNDELKD